MICYVCYVYIWYVIYVITCYITYDMLCYVMLWLLNCISFQCNCENSVLFALGEKCKTAQHNTTQHNYCIYMLCYITYDMLCYITYVMYNIWYVMLYNMIYYVI